MRKKAAGDPAAVSGAAHNRVVPRCRRRGYPGMAHREPSPVRGLSDSADYEVGAGSSQLIRSSITVEPRSESVSW